MSFFQNFDWSFKSIAKLIGIILLGIVALAVVIAMVAFSFRTVFQSASYNRGGYTDYAPTPYAAKESLMMEGGKGGGGGDYYARQAYIFPPEYSPGTDAEQFEVKTHNATIKTRKLEKTCAKVSELKSREDVIFETSNVNENDCYFSFKVKKEKEAEIVALVESLKPENLNVHVETIKGTVDFYDKELEILENKLASIEDTLTKAQKAYDEVSRLATQARDVESLTKIIDSKLNLIERLSNQRIQVKEDIDRYKQNKSDAMDRLNFSFFNINIFEDLIFDWKQIKDSWKWELKSLVDNFNGVIQGITVQLVTYMIRFIQVAIYFFLSVFLLKFAWVATKKIWTWRRQS